MVFCYDYGITNFNSLGGENMDTDVRSRLSREHYGKFDAIAQDLGIDRLISLVPYGKEILINGYNTGDIHYS